ncbi:MAG: thymidine phosphorylase [Candidatus Promineifilaceae bacterium]
MNMIALIKQKRDGGELSSAEIKQFVTGVADNTLPDYQIAAMLMAIYLRGMSRRETVDLTLAMAASGDTLDLHDVAKFVIDKHSSGGVGDKTTLVVQPLVAACGVPVGKMSGRGLGITGGTLDKMESIAGWDSQFTIAEFKQQLGEIGLVLAGQSADLAPADGKLYALRDVTATVGSIPLIAGSIMSKKLASGADGVVLDVKVGSGSFMKTVEQARQLARTMVDIGNDAGRKTVALLSDMNQPLGYAVGNALEVREAIWALQGKPTPSDFWTHCVTLAAHMLLVSGRTKTLAEAEILVNTARDSGAAFAKFREMVVAQGGDGALIDEPKRLSKAAIIRPITAQHSGYIAAIDTEALGWQIVEMGGGRKQKTDRLDHAVGFELFAKVGTYYQAGEQLGVVHVQGEAGMISAEKTIHHALTWSQDPVASLPQFYDVLS